jgi:hypothetical protein
MAFAPIVRATAVYGISGMVAWSLRGAAEVQRLMGLARTGDEQKYFKARAEALAWLHRL